MAYTEKVGLNSTALSILLYECINSTNSQEGFLIGEVTSEISNHISDSHNDTARLDTKIMVKNILPLPSVSMFYFPTGVIKEDIVKDLLSSNASEVVGWYKYRKNSCLKPTFRDKLILRGLQKYFEKYHGKKQFIGCNLSNKVSPGGATYTLTYRFGKINCFNSYEHLEDVTANLGEKISGYKRYSKPPSNSVFQSVINESNVQNNSSSDAILRIQDVINKKLQEEAKLAAKNEKTIRELENDIKQMIDMLGTKQATDLEFANDKLIEEKFINRDIEMAEACAAAMKPVADADSLNIPNLLQNSHDLSNSDNAVLLVQSDRIPNPALPSTSTGRQTNYNCSSIRKKNANESSSNVINNCSDDLITFDVDEREAQKPITINDNLKRLDDSSPEY